MIINDEINDIKTSINDSDAKLNGLKYIARCPNQKSRQENSLQ